METQYSWNPVYNLIMKIKYDYLKQFKDISYEPSIQNGKEISCLERWVAELGINEYIKILEPLQINQNGKLVLIRYGRYSDVFGGENDITNENFWELYDGFYQECRSLVINIKDETIVLSPFKKFRNLNEGAENQIDIIKQKIKNANSFEISNKLDGSMQSARYYNSKIIMSGSQSINKNNSWRLKDGYNMLTKQHNYVDMIKDFPDYTFIFEYISLKDAHVVNYNLEDEGLYLLGMRNVYTGEQLSYNKVKALTKHYGVRMTELFNKSFDDIINDTKKYKSDKMEGYVLNIDGHFVKIKCDDYVHIHKILSNISSINLIIKSIADNTFDDLISKVPDSYKWRVMRVANLVFNYIKNTDKLVNNYYSKSPKENKKDFMLWIDKNVPIEIRGYVRNKYLGKDINYIKGGNKQCPSYKKLRDMGIDKDYSAIFVSEEEYNE